MTSPRLSPELTPTLQHTDEDRFPTVEHFAGLPIARITRAEIERAITADVDTDRGGWVVTANLDHLRRVGTDRSGRTQDLLQECDVIVADGMPLVWASKLAGQPLPERIAGSDMIVSLSARVGDAGGRVLLLGGQPGAAEDAARILRSATPRLAVDTVCPPYGFEHDVAQLERLEDTIRSAGPDVVFVALGFPKQDELIRRLRRAYPRAWYVGVGVSVDFVAGRVSRAPRWMQRTGTEWLHRMTQEPGRLFVRYVVHGIPFAVRLFRWSATTRLRGSVSDRRGRDVSNS